MADGINPKIAVMLDRADIWDGILKSKAALPTLKDGGDLTIITKPGIMKPSGGAGAMVTFTVEAPEGKLALAQTVVSVKLLMATLRILEAHYTDAGVPKSRNETH